MPEETAPATATPQTPTQGDPEQLGDAGKRALDAERQGRAAAEKQVKDLATTVQEMQAKQDAQAKAMAAALGLKPEETSADVLASQVKAMQDQLATTQSTNLRQQVALEKRLPSELAARLVGTTEQELAADADALLALMGNGAPSYDGGTRTSAGGPFDMNQAIRERLNR